MQNDTQMRCAASVDGAERTSATTTIGDEGGAASDTMRVFAGLRADPFFLDIVRVRLPHAAHLELPIPGVNAFALANVLSVVAEVDIASILGGTSDGSVFAVTADTTAIATEAP
jgi:hypothetical protein